MKITVEFLSLPNVTKIIGSKTLLVNFSGKTIEDLLNQIVNSYGPKLGNFLLDDSGKLDMVFQVYLNRKIRIPREQMNKILKDGDQVTIMMLVGGG